MLDANPIPPQIIIMLVTSLITFASLASWASAGLLPLRPVPISASPLYQEPSFFPTIFAGARYVGYFLDSTFQSTIGQENVQRLDTVINQFCLAPLDSQRDSKTCQQILAKLDRLAAQSTPLKKSQRYQELLSAACTITDLDSTIVIESCQPLLADSEDFTHSTFDTAVKKWRFMR